MIAFVLHSKKWGEEITESEEIELEAAAGGIVHEGKATEESNGDIDFFKLFPAALKTVREKGRQFCVHENKLYQERMNWLCPHIMLAEKDKDKDDDNVKKI